MSNLVDGAFEVENLIGIPSLHYEPIFAQVAARALAAFQPSVVALELPDGLIGELEWASARWPGPVVTQSESALFPFVAGDSIFEAYRLATAARIPVVLVDLAAAGPPTIQPAETNANPPGPEFTRAGAGLFLGVSDLFFSRAVAPERWSDAREAHTARRLKQLLGQGETVLWVGGMAHWTRIVARINKGNFNAPSVDVAVDSRFNRMHLAPSALHRMTGRIPWLIAQYAQSPSTYDEHSATQILCLQAKNEPDKETAVLVLSAGSDG